MLHIKLKSLTDNHSTQIYLLNPTEYFKKSSVLQKDSFPNENTSI